MTANGIPLSKVHGLNPTIPKCFFCWEDKSEVILPGRLPNDQAAPRDATWDMEPCITCAGYMQQGIIVISVRDDQAEVIAQARAQRKIPNPFRTGGWWVVTEQAIRRELNEKTADRLARMRWAFMPDSVCTHLGLMQEDGTPVVNNRPLGGVDRQVEGASEDAPLDDNEQKEGNNDDDPQ